MNITQTAAKLERDARTYRLASLRVGNPDAERSAVSAMTSVWRFQSTGNAEHLEAAQRHLTMAEVQFLTALDAD
jgi:hypothetical protein